MSINKLLNDKDTSAEEKLNSVAEIVKELRSSYGNTDVDIPTEKVNTPEGQVLFSHLENESKVSLLLNRVRRIKVSSLSFVELNPGTVLAKKEQELLATDSLFVNISTGSGFSYL